MEGYIYSIINKNNGKYYIGSTKEVKRRFSTHRNNLNKNRHKNKHLQSAWNKYGEDSFEFKVVQEFEKISRKDLYKEEQKYLDRLDKKEVYNLAYCAYGVNSTVNSIPCYILTLGGDIVKEFESRNEAAIYLGFKNSGCLRSSKYPKAKVTSKIDGKRYRVINKDYYEQHTEEVLKYPESTKNEMYQKYLETRKEPCHKKYDYNGKELFISKIAELESVSTQAIYSRIKNKGSFDSPIKKYEYKGEMLTQPEIAEREGVSRQAIYRRFEKNGTWKKTRKHNL